MPNHLISHFNNRAVQPALAAIHLVVAKFGTSSALERSGKQGRGNIHNALRVLDLCANQATLWQK